eukprot:TRINITY_DN12008_c0_g1_i1.p1 TRINITY_DN12008_c0_g1~~TRINITY_DN12008_c0_g1_i1.p1  ORF type:complete len:851 (+),score=208.30 TRINITY_DN12008_c0_g1_i1:68-2620(+)
MAWVVASPLSRRLSAPMRCKHSCGAAELRRPLGLRLRCPPGEEGSFLHAGLSPAARSFSSSSSTCSGTVSSSGGGGGGGGGGSSSSTSSARDHVRGGTAQSPSVAAVSSRRSLQASEEGDLATGPELLLDEPILADFLAVDAAKTVLARGAREGGAAMATRPSGDPADDLGAALSAELLIRPPGKGHITPARHGINGHMAPPINGHTAAINGRRAAAMEGPAFRAEAADLLEAEEQALKVSSQRDAAEPAQRSQARIQPVRDRASQASDAQQSAGRPARLDTDAARATAANDVAEPAVDGRTSSWSQAFAALLQKPAVRNRRLVEAALQSPTAVRNDPSSTSAAASRRQAIDAESSGLNLRPRSLPTLFSEAASQPFRRKAEDVSSRWAAANRVLETATQQQADAPFSSWGSTSASSSSAGVGQTTNKAAGKMHMKLRQHLCKTVFLDFTRIVHGKAVAQLQDGVETTSLQARLLFTKFEWDMAARLISEGKLADVVWHLCDTELHLEKGHLRKKHLAAAARREAAALTEISANDLRDERRTLAAERNNRLRNTAWGHGRLWTLGEGIAVDLHLDKALSWTRLRVAMDDAMQVDGAATAKASFARLAYPSSSPAEAGKAAATANLTAGLRRSLCRILLDDFEQVMVKKLKAELPSPAEAAASSTRPLVSYFTLWEWDVTARLSREGNIADLVWHLLDTETHLEQGERRRELLLKSGGGPPAKDLSPDTARALRDERRAILDARRELQDQVKLGRQRLRALGEGVAVELYFEQQLTWRRLRGSLDAVLETERFEASNKANNGDAASAAGAVAACFACVVVVDNGPSGTDVYLVGDEDPDPAPADTAECVAE